MPLALVAAISSMTNSISTIFSMGIYPPVTKKENRKDLMTVGRTDAVISMIIVFAVATSLWQKKEDHEGIVDLRVIDFSIKTSFNVASIAVVAVVAALYPVWQ